MTREQATKVTLLMMLTERYLPLVPTGPFAMSLAKYHEVLERLASK